MKLLIDIPEHIYEHAKETTEDSNDEFDAMRAIANGTQQESRSENPNKSEIPTSCGDAISREAVLDVTWEEPSYTDALNVLTEVRDKVKVLPSVTPQQKTDVFDKIRAEIDSYCSDNRDRNDGLYIAMKIIDKYKAESEVDS